MTCQQNQFLNKQKRRSLCIIVCETLLMQRNEMEDENKAKKRTKNKRRDRMRAQWNMQKRVEIKKTRPTPTV